LHDGLGSGATGILMLTQQLPPDAQIGNNYSRQVEKIKKTANDMVDQMAEIVWALNTQNDTLANLLSYTRQYVNEQFEDTDVFCEFDFPVNVPDKKLSSLERRNIFLVIKEAINNIRKYSKANRITIVFNQHSSTYRLAITDNGLGFDLQNTREFGNGLKNMAFRIEEIGGKFVVKSKNNEGTQIEVIFS
jgi:signal transduction histidine kinase